MKKTIRNIASVLLILLLLIPSLAAAETAPLADYVQSGNEAEITVIGDRGKNVSITVKDQDRYYFMSQGVTDDSGRAEFKAVLDTGKEYEYKVNIDGKVLAGKIEMKKTPVDPEPDNKYADLYIKGYKGVILDESNIKIKEGESVLSFTLRMLDEKGISYKNKNGYISSIDGQAEFDRGDESGWMFLVNGVLSGKGAGAVTVINGDTVKWLYTEDLGKDIGGGFSSGESQGNGTITAETKVVNKEATSKADEKQIKEAIEEAKKAKNVSSITVKAEAKEAVTKFTVAVPRSSIAEISGAGLDLRVETSLGAITVPEKALNEISEQAQGGTMEVVIENISPDKLTAEQKALTEGSTVYDISIISGGKIISSFGGHKITISLPYRLKEGQVSEKVTVWYMNDKGELEKISCTYDEKTGLATFTADHLSYYAVGYDSSISFVDVTEKDWFFEYIMYAAEKGLFSGTGENTFSPDMPMTRSMLITVLHRLEGKPATANAADFADIPAGQWYTDAVNWSSEKEIVKGVTETEFMPESNITREQLAVILYRYASSKNMAADDLGSIGSFRDNDKVSAWAETAVRWAAGKGIITGREDNTLDPSGSATRAEVAAMLKRYIEKVK
jgi:hypothetical protein